MLALAAGGTAARAAPERLPPPAVTEPSWRLVLEGGVTRVREFDNGAAARADRVTSLARDTYRATVTVLFRLGADGTVTGYGSGRYTEAAWHLEGVNGARGRFACDPRSRPRRSASTSPAGRPPAGSCSS